MNKLEEFGKIKDPNKIQQFFKYDGFIDLSNELLEYHIEINLD